VNDSQVALSVSSPGRDLMFYPSLVGPSLPAPADLRPSPDASLGPLLNKSEHSSQSGLFSEASKLITGISSSMIGRANSRLKMITWQRRP